MLKAPHKIISCCECMCLLLCEHLQSVKNKQQGCFLFPPPHPHSPIPRNNWYQVCGGLTFYTKACAAQAACPAQALLVFLTKYAECSTQSRAFPKGHDQRSHQFLDVFSPACNSGPQSQSQSADSWSRTCLVVSHAGLLVVSDNISKKKLDDFIKRHHVQEGSGTQQPPLAHCWPTEPDFH